MGRNTQGVTLIQTDDGDQLVSIARLAEEDADAQTDDEAADTVADQAPTETPGSES